MLKLLRKINGEGFESNVWFDSVVNRGFFVADMDIDSDGGKNIDGDKYWQPDTSLHHEGKAIDALTVPGVVLPGWIPKAVGPIVLGCRARVTNLRNMRSAEGVVHDTGPLTKTGECTPKMAELVGVSPNSVTGGEDSPVILYEFWPGMAAILDGVVYQLQASK